MSNNIPYDNRHSFNSARLSLWFLVHRANLHIMGNQCLRKYPMGVHTNLDNQYSIDIVFSRVPQNEIRISRCNSESIWMLTSATVAGFGYGCWLFFLFRSIVRWHAVNVGSCRSVSSEIPPMLCWLIWRGFSRPSEARFRIFATDLARFRIFAIDFRSSKDHLDVISDHCCIINYQLQSSLIIGLDASPRCTSISIESCLIAKSFTQ